MGVNIWTPVVSTYHVVREKNILQINIKLGSLGPFHLYGTKFMLKNDKEIAEFINSVLVFIEKNLQITPISNNLLTDKKLRKMDRDTGSLTVDKLDISKA